MYIYIYISRRTRIMPSLTYSSSSLNLTHHQWSFSSSLTANSQLPTLQPREIQSATYTMTVMHSPRTPRYKREVDTANDTARTPVHITYQAVKSKKKRPPNEAARMMFIHYKPLMGLLCAWRIRYPPEHWIACEPQGIGPTRCIKQNGNDPKI